jgi:hypothetical protein
MKKTLVFLTLLAGLAVSARATSILSDDFNYPNGPIVGATGSPWLYNSGTAGSMYVTNGQLEVTSARSEDIAAALSGSPYMTNGAVAAVYSKFTVKFTALPSASGTYFAHFNGENPPPNATLHRCRIWASATNTVASTPLPAGKFRLGIVNSSSGNATTAQWDADLDTNVTYTVVTRYDIATATSTLWIDPDSEASPSVTANDSVSPFINVVYYSFRQASGEGTMLIDDLRVATTFAEVAGTNTAPTISSITTQSIPRDGSTGALPFTVGDAESDPATLTVSKASTNTTLVPLSGIVINNGDGTNRTVTVTPAAGQQGRTLITLTVSDGVNTVDSSFLVIVGAPVLSAIPNQIAISNTPIPAIAFTITDAEGDPLTASASSSNTNLLKNGNITINGTGSNRTLTLVPEPNMTGFTTVTLSFSDSYNTTTRSFGLTVSPRLGILLQDQFAYTSFLLPNALYGATDSPWQTVSGTPYEVQSTNGWAYLSAAHTEDVAASLTNSAGVFPGFTNYAASEGVAFYSSFTLRVTTLPTGDGDYFAHLKSFYNATTFRAKVFVSTNGAAPGSYRIGVANQANAGTYYPLNCSPNTDYLVVTRYNSPIGETALWVNPVAESVGAVIATDALQTSPIGAYGLRQSGGIGELQISNLVVSTSFPTLPGLSPIQITRINVSGGTVTVDFDAGAGDAAAGFDLVAAAAVNGTYNPVAGAVITNPSSGKFQATAATSGNTQFYRIKRK